MCVCVCVCVLVNQQLNNILPKLPTTDKYSMFVSDTMKENDSTSESPNHNIYIKKQLQITYDDMTQNVINLKLIK